MAHHAAQPQFDAPIPPGVRAQLLATEHWGLLAARTTAQNEVLARIAIFLTLVSAGLVSLALVGQATNFSDAFIAFSVGVLAFIVLVGVLTQVRVMNIGMEDLMYVVAMNRLRGAYVELDPGVEHAFMSSTHDDFLGVQQTYYFFSPKRGISQVFGSTMAFIILINSALLGLFVASVFALSTASLPMAVVVGAAVALIYFTSLFWLGNRRFRATIAGYRPLYPSQAEPQNDP
ncbi:low affinity Fe/Cu permease [Okibacterium sp. HSC-33S16]|uniref:hypothetical protein n=1 Tax=Okibacterium sp. HSC-33S16 TaxID=2910965 RepID=UPI00209C6F7C|nr:hypothetical protein [Okibacterium sp. HSC-33S16]MCP2032480.1 low affinity Fe/Cu permease [Okibacterium sp. HSC-33S16]